MIIGEILVLYGGIFDLYRNAIYDTLSEDKTNNIGAHAPRERELLTQRREKAYSS